MFYEGAGEELRGGFFFAVWALICDLEHAWHNYDLPHPGANACCALCCVGLQMGLHWFDFRPNAAWLNHIYTVQSWLARGLNNMLATWELIGRPVFSFGLSLIFILVIANMKYRTLEL